MYQLKMLNLANNFIMNNDIRNFILENWKEKINEYIYVKKNTCGLTYFCYLSPK